MNKNTIDGRQQPTEGVTEQAHRASVFAGFLGLGFFIGVHAVLIADLARAFALTEGALGVALGAFSGVGILSLILGGRVADRVGRRPLLVVGAFLAGAFFVLLALLAGTSYPVLLATLALGGAGSGFYDLAVNTLGGDHERQHEVKAMTFLHAGWSGGAAIGALVSGLALAWGADFRLVYAAVGGLLVLLAAILAIVPLPGRDEVPHHAPDGTVSEADRRAPEWWAAEEGESERSVLLLPAVLLATTLVCATFFTDSALTGFSSLYLREVLGSGAAVGGAGIAAFHAAGVVGRLVGSEAIRRFGERAVLVAAGLGAAFGLGLLTATGFAWVSALGLLLTGISLSPIVPVGFSLAARSAPGRSARAISVVTSFGYGMFLVGPVIVGLLADLLTLRLTLAMFVPVSLTIAFLAHQGLKRWAP